MHTEKQYNRDYDLNFDISYVILFKNYSFLNTNFKNRIERGYRLCFFSGPPVSPGSLSVWAM